jgi:hypothetical protein
VFPTLLDSSRAYFAITGEIVPRVVDGRKKSIKIFIIDRTTILLVTIENSPSLIILSRILSETSMRKTKNDVTSSRRETILAGE